MTNPTVTISFGRLEGWVLGESLLGTDTTLATYTYEDITAPVIDFDIRRGRQHELDRIEAGVATLTFMNQDGAFTPTNTASPYYPDIRPMSPIKITAEIVESFSPTDVAGCIAWYDFSDAATLFEDTARTDPVDVDTDIIKGVTDKSGVGNHLSEVTNGPAYRTGIRNGLSVSRFDGTNDILQGPTTTETQPTTVIAVAVSDTTDASNRQIIATENASSSAIGRNNGVPSKWNLWNGTSLVGGNADTSWHIHVGVSNTTSSKRYVDGGTPATGNSGTNAWSNWTIGSYADLSQFWDGDIGEILMYSGALSASDINLIGAYLASRWAVTWTDVS